MDKQKHRESRRKKEKLNYNNKKKERNSKASDSKPSPAKPYLLANFERTGVSSDEDDFDDDFYSFDYVTKSTLTQPSSSFAEVVDQDDTDVKSSNDFNYLANTALTSGYFQFKSEKNWSVDTSKFSDLLAFDVKNLSIIFNCIPFNQTIEVDDKYFTKDQLTSFNTTAEQAKKIYEQELHDKERQQKLSDENRRNSKESSPKVDSIDDDTVEDLDFLLSLKEPVKTSSVTSLLAPKQTNEPKPNSAPSTKSIDLEKWLDSVLDI
ncbi:uncharacterized protein LOC103576342 [Microplitis demolitor]|uniref:uncharacterized protein LOC103576342 n=1 Tax=Microplitis demolitor TaxID=69319 RepID=UPI0004CD41D2|nr:uncharacterized protein LOC103576342 [Microplitis demolitor]